MFLEGSVSKQSQRWVRWSCCRQDRRTLQVTRWVRKGVRSIMLLGDFRQPQWASWSSCWLNQTIEFVQTVEPLIPNGRMSLSLFFLSSQNISKWKFDIVTFTIIEGFCFPECMIICFVGVLYARNSLAWWFLVQLIFCNMNYVGWWWVQNQETLSGLASLLHQPYSWILFMLLLDVRHDFCLLVR